MNWKLPVLLFGIVVFTACGSSPKSDAEKVCDCGYEIIGLLNDNASEKDIEAKWDECDKIYGDFEAKYKENPDKLKEFNDAGEACSDKMEAEMDAAMEKWQTANEKE
ncbi:hypothetical protein SDC9_58915 [bioreactor metagenome]|uniref:Lipoprotein n=1 Tax=bioreactor metagenome TaxID=1076179 RepID=A0A644X8S9_9ZZZZ